MALNLGLESLQGEIQQAEEKPVELSDLLDSQIEFNEAYQAFIDYKNVCEIVTKAKVSNENLAFASELLNASIENIQVSVEDLQEKLKTAWSKFVEMWNKFVSWIKNAFQQIISKLKTKKTAQSETDKVENITLPIKNVIPTRPDLYVLTRGFADTHNIAMSSKKTSTTNETYSCDLDTRNLRNALLNSSGETLTTKEDVLLWIKDAKKFIEIFDKHVKYCTDNIQKFKDEWRSISKTVLRNGSELSKKKFFGPEISARYLMIYGPKIIKQINMTINKFSKIDA